MPGIVHILDHQLFASFGLSAIIQSKAINIETPLSLHHHGATLISNISKPTTPNWDAICEQSQTKKAIENKMVVLLKFKW